MGATLVRSSEAPRFEVHGAKVVAYASPSRGSASLSTWKVTLDAGAQSPLHALDADEVFLCVAGAADFDVAGQRLTVSPGDTITVTAGSQFRISTRGAEPFEAVVAVRAGLKARVEGGEPFSPPWAL